MVAQAGDADADAVGRVTRGSEAPDQLRDAADNLVGRRRAAGILARLVDDLSVAVDDAGEQLAAADVHAEGQHASCSTTLSSIDATSR